MKEAIRDLKFLRNIIIPIMMILFSLYNILQLITTKYPTHSDVFWLGVQCGVIGTFSILLLESFLFLKGNHEDAALNHAFLQASENDYPTLLSHGSILIK